MKQTFFQEYMEKERKRVIQKFQKRYKTRKEKEDILKELERQDIQFLLYCSDNIYANIFYSKYLKNDIIN